MNNLGYNPGFNQMTGDMQFQHHPSQQGPQNQMQTYQNSGYKNKRGKKKSLILDIRDGTNLTQNVTDPATGSTSNVLQGVSKTHLTAASEFNISLREPLIIDKHSEIYLDNLVTYNCNLSDIHENSAFCLKVNEFNIDTNVASIDDTDENTIFNSIVLPNENNDVNNYFGAVVHKGRKFNYVCDINPCTISSLSGRLTNLNGNPAFHGITLNNDTHTYALVGITGWGTTTGNLTANTSITILSVGGVDKYSSGGTGTILADSQVGSSAIIFSSSIALTPGDFDGATAVTLNTYSLTATSFFLRESNGCRMVAEFTIESFD
jgi:hypothetical protein